ncbi:MAG TPA: thioredoxin [Elusimicrobia bacterium]|nr:thioredoxin [Elusimicrobiota bacterium]HBT60674.1 thioredoxin [Elusimicrobiota bacterium]
MAELELTDATFQREVLESPQPVLVDFWAPWCGPCRMLAPVIKELSEEYQGRVRVAKLNTDEHSNAAGTYRISAIPSLLFFKNGKVVEQLVGVHSKAEIKKIIESLFTAA